MNPAAIIADAYADGLILSLASDGQLAFKGPRAAADKWLPVLKEAKTAVVAHLSRAQRPAWDAADWQALFDERAAVLEYERGFSRPEAEYQAWRSCLAEWLNRNPACSAPNRCQGCGGTNAREPLLPFDTTATGSTWLHRGCWQAWYENRVAEAAAALKGLGIKSAIEAGT